MLVTHTWCKALCRGLGGQPKEHVLHPQRLEPKSGEGRCSWMKRACWDELQKLAEQASEKQCIASSIMNGARGKWPRAESGEKTWPKEMPESLTFDEGHGRGGKRADQRGRLKLIQKFLVVSYMEHLLSEQASTEFLWSLGSLPPPGDLPRPGVELTSLVSPRVARQIVYHWVTSGAP